MLNNVPTTGGTWEYVPSFVFDATETQTIKAFIDADDHAAAAAYIESIYGGSFTDVALYQNFAISYANENEQVLESDNCAIKEAARYSTLVPSVTVDLFETTNLQLFAEATGVSLQSVASAPVAPASTTQTSGTWSFSSPFRAGSPKGATAVSIATVTGSVDGLLVLNVDYTVDTDADGYATITIIDSATVTTAVQDITYDLGYTPIASTYTGFCIESRNVPYNLFKFTTCPNANGESDVFYMYKFSLNTDWTMTFASLDRDGQSFVSSNIGFQGAKGGLMVLCDGTSTSL